MLRISPSAYRSSTQAVSMLNLQESNISILFSPLLFWKIEVTPRTATKFFSLLLSCVALGSDTQGTHKEQNLLFVRHARGRKLESGVQKNRSIKPKIRWKAKGLPDVWQGQHQVLEVHQAIIYNLKMLKKPGNTPFSGLFLCLKSPDSDGEIWGNLTSN